MPDCLVEIRQMFDLSDGIAGFGDILNKDGPLVEIGLPSVFVNSGVGGEQLPAGQGSAHDLTPLVWRRGARGQRYSGQ